ncbi:MAG TPA: hypothetical protein VMT17_08520 [Anaeromyxobacteraceae bacterium]|nr:hypothetical protein [Anaeromyxobacteraceae bacterium]
MSTRCRARGAGALAVALCLSTACASARPAARGPQDAPPATEVSFAEGTAVDVSRLDLELAGKNDEELFAIAQAAFAAGDYRRAAAAFGRVADLHPASSRRAAALFDAGLSHERLAEWRDALRRFEQFDAGYAGPDADEAAFHAAAALWRLAELASARAALERLAARGDLSDANRIRAFTELGVVQIDLADLDAAEQSLRRAVSLWTDARDRERLDPYHPAQAHYYLGEVARRRFRAVALDPSREADSALEAALERKSEFLLAAQGYYLRAIRVGDPDWAVASGYRIGELYDELHAQMTAAPLPPGLPDEEAKVYREELARKVRVLLVKAITVYEQTLQAARQGGVDNRFVEEAQRAVERMKRSLVEADALPGDAGAAAPAPAAPPHPAAPASPRG